jgi:hypothetical protein
MKRFRAVFAELLLSGLVLPAQQPKTFSFETYDQVTIRKNPTTQIGIRIAEWPGQRFILWLPEWINDLWWQWDPPVAHQAFTKTDRGGLRWEFAGNPKARITAELIPRKAALLFEVRVKNLTSEDLLHVAIQNCLPLSEAPDFACRDFSQLYLRMAKKWRSLAELGITDPRPMFYRAGFLESGRIDAWQGKFKSHNQKERVDYPLMIVRSRDGKRAIGTASEDYQCVFHNHSDQYLLCLHSQQAPLDKLPAGDEVVFRQMLYFTEGGIKEVVDAYESDIKRGALKR